jgi:hypothetical protein
VAAVSDGAGSASHSHVGSAILCEAIVGQVESFLKSGRTLSSIFRFDVDAWLAAALEALRAHAETHELEPRDLAATFLGCVSDPTVTACFQVGDGAIVIDDPAVEFAPVFWPQRGEYANTTVFLCDAEAIEQAAFQVVPRRVDRIAVLSDGLQMVALNYATQSAHAPFFAGLFNTLEQHAAGEHAQLNFALDDLLDRKTITDRTDDDRTLVLASRRQLP